MDISPQAIYADRARAEGGKANENFCGCFVVNATEYHGCQSRFSRPVATLFSELVLSLPHEAEWTTFQIHRF
jgi:hypothetical protein